MVMRGIYREPGQVREDVGDRGRWMPSRQEVVRVVAKGVFAVGFTTLWWVVLMLIAAENWR